MMWFVFSQARKTLTKIRIFTGKIRDGANSYSHKISCNCQGFFFFFCMSAKKNMWCLCTSFQALELNLLLETVVKPWIDSVRNERSYVFQQNSAPSYKAQRMQEWTAENFQNYLTPNIWPPTFPTLNPLDYYV